MMLHAHRLIVDMKQEYLNIEAPDPFVTDTDSRWIVDKLVCSYRDAIAKCELFKEAKEAKDIAGIRFVTL